MSKHATIALAAGLFAALQARAAPVRGHLAEPQYLPEAARALLHTRMQHHGESMTELLSTVVLLDYEGTQRSAREIVEEPRLARPTTMDATQLNSRLPERFFALQDQLHMRAAQLEATATAHDPARLASAYGQLAETCVACHAVYLSGTR
jgi:cytochrome c556